MEDTIYISELFECSQIEKEMSSQLIQFDRKIEALERLTSLQASIEEYGVSSTTLEVACSGLEGMEMTRNEILSYPLHFTKHQGVCEDIGDKIKSAIKKVWEWIYNFFKGIVNIIKKIFGKLFNLTSQQISRQEKLTRIISDKDFEIDEASFSKSKLNLYPIQTYLVAMQQQNNVISTFLTKVSETVDTALTMMDSPDVTQQELDSYKKTVTGMFDTLAGEKKPEKGAMDMKVFLERYYGVAMYKDNDEYYFRSFTPTMKSETKVVTEEGFIAHSGETLRNVILRRNLVMGTVSRKIDEEQERVEKLRSTYGKSTSVIRDQIRNNDNLSSEEVSRRTEYIKLYQKIVNFSTVLMKNHYQTQVKIIRDLNNVSELAIKCQVKK